MNLESSLPERWESMLQDLETAFAIGITVHDQQGCLSDRQGRLLIRGRHLHPHTVCQRQERRVYGAALCHAHCVTAVDARAREARRDFLTSCWKGVQEVVVPVFRGEIYALALFAGPFRNPNVAGPDPRRFPPAIRAAWRALPTVSPERRATLARVLHTVGQGMLAEAEEAIGLTEDADSRAHQIRAFIHRHAHEPVALGDLAASLHLSPSRTTHAVTELFGASFKQLLLAERIRRAQALLRASALPIAEIGRRVGLANPHYFSRTFKKRTGLTPGRYRREGA